VQVDVSTALALAAVVFAAGGAWITITRTDKRGTVQGKRLGALEIKVAEIRAELRTRRRTLPTGLPVATTTEEPTHGD
jgi:hypothetical protein